MPQTVKQQQQQPGLELQVVVWGFNPYFWVKMGFKFQFLGKISNISTSGPPVLLGQFQHWQQQ